MPVCYGGGIKDLKQIEKILKLALKNLKNSKSIVDRDFIRKASRNFGSSTIAVSVDVIKSFFGKYNIHSHSSTKHQMNIFDYVKQIKEYGAGEILINYVNNDGMMNGYNLKLINKISTSVSIPVIACGGASSIEDFRDVIKSKASAAAVGSYFVFYGPHKAAFTISYPNQSELNYLLLKR